MSSTRPNLVLLRREMVQVGRRMYDQGLIVAAEGNLSVRLGGHSFLVTPAGRGKGSLRVQDLVEIDFQGRSPQGAATSEWPLHAQIYTLRPDVRAVCHAHPPWATAFAAAGRDLDGGLLTETAALLPRVPLAARSLPGTDALATSVVPFIPNCDAVLLGNHGVVTVGADLPSAFNLLETVERLAQVTLLAEAAAGNSCLDPATLRNLQNPDR
ncbi:MAG: class II aldolase/adducin family protein [Candidatus Krumholzibacteriota bacterium]